MATLRGSGHKGVLMGTRAVSGEKGLPVDTRACQWAQGPVSGHKGLSVGIRTCQWRINWHKGVLVYTKPVNGYKFTLEAVHL